MSSLFRPEQIVESLREMRFPSTFNPYVDLCEKFDREDSADCRSKILCEILRFAGNMYIDSFWIGRDLGHRGGRRTGLALTDDAHFADHLCRWGLQQPRPVEGVIIKERTAGAIWEMLNQISKNIFLWNVFPLHPHPIGSEFRNRPHNAEERRAGLKILLALVVTLNPKRIIAIGNDAAVACQMLFPKKEINRVRHPSYGGENEFRLEISRLYGLQK